MNAKHSNPVAQGTGTAGGRQAGADRRDIVVFWLVSDSACAECERELAKGRFLRIEGERPLCLVCADLDHLVFLPRGDAALTRRAGKYSILRATVVRFSRSRKRYERQGVLVEESALERAERECLADAAVRERARERAADRRKDVDERYVSKFTERLRDSFPGCPAQECRAIADHACRKYSGRVGRSAVASRFDPGPLELAVRAHVRHRHTPYDELLAQGVQRSDARAVVRGAVDEVVERWKGTLPTTRP